MTVLRETLRPSMTRRSFLFAALCALCVAGCSHRSAPATTEELLLRYTSLDDFDNFRADVSADVAIKGVGWRARVPVHADISCAEGRAAGTVTLDLSSLGSRDYVVDVLAEMRDLKLDCYLGTTEGDATSWRIKTIDLSEPIDIFTVTRLLRASELTVIAKDTDPLARFELTVPTRTVLETAFELAGTEPVVDLDDFEGDRMDVDFTEDCHLRSVETEARFDLTDETRSTSVEVDLDLRAVLDGFGTVDAASLSIPEEVRQQAQPTDNLLEVSEVIERASPLYSMVVG